MTWFRVGGAGIPASLKNKMNSVLNKKFGTTGQNYPPNGWPDDVNLLGPLPIKNASGAIASFSDGADDVPIASGVFSFLPSQAGSGTPSPSNPRAISGYTGMTIYQTGKNIFDKTAKDTDKGYIAGSWLRNTGTVSENADYYISEYIPVKGGQDYTLQGLYGNAISFCEYDDTKNYVTGTRYTNNATLTVTLNGNTRYIRITVYTTNEDITMVEVGSSASTYTAFVGAKTPIVDSFGATVYGGSRATDGTLTIEYLLITLDGTQNVLSGNYGTGGYVQYSCEALGIDVDTIKTIYANMYLDASTGSYRINTLEASGIKCIRFNDARFGDTITSKNEWNAWLTNNNIVIAYPLATPITTTLEAVNINSYYGSNNIYTDIGECSINYRADIDLLLAALQGSRSLSSSLMRSAGPEEVGEPEENIQNTEEQEGENDAR